MKKEKKEKTARIIEKRIMKKERRKSKVKNSKKKKTSCDKLHNFVYSMHACEDAYALCHFQS